MKILVCYGTRPEYIKIEPVLRGMNGLIEYRTLYIRQHTTLIDVNNPNHILTLGLADNRLDAVIGSLGFFKDHYFDDITHVMVQGDTSTALACAMAAFHRNIPVIHLEAGLRTYDNQNPYPEEVYRQMISRIASIHLCPTIENALNLSNEKINGRTFITGNTGLDHLIDLRNKIEYNNEILVTLHRRENHKNIRSWFQELSNLAKEYPELQFTIPLHPNPNIQAAEKFLVGINVIDPIPSDKFAERLSKCRMVITDSGGIQEECAFFGKKAIVCREVTERQEAVGQSSILCTSPEHLKIIFGGNIKTYNIDQSNVYGDGYSAIRVIQVLKQLEN